MDEKELAIIGDDSNYWWFRAKDDLIEDIVIERCGLGSKIINIGAGTTEYEYAYNYRGKIQDYMTTKRYDCAILADVIEHIPPRDRKRALKSVHKLLKDKGKVIITVPAMQCLFNAHDKFLGHYLRYDKKTLKKELKAAGFKPVSVNYWNSFLFVPIALRKLLNKEGKNSDLKKMPRWLNSLLYTILNLETPLILIGLSLPFGISVVGVFEKC